jgi:uncharacterized RDD family membrane protein YckC
VTQFPSAAPLDLHVTAGVLPRRFLALVLDAFVIAILGWVAAICIVIFGILTLGVGWLAFHIIPFIPFGYYTLLIGSSGATPGQRALGLVVRQDSDLAQPNLAQALVWSILLWLSFIFAGVPFLLVFLNPQHRATHDILSGLVILRADKNPYSAVSR